MKFYELIASALDDNGIESRIHDECLFVPITPEVELRFVELDAHIPAANVYVAAADLEDDEDDDAALVAAVFSVEDAVKTVDEHVVTDQAISLIRELLDGVEERIADLDFYQDDNIATRVHADVATRSTITVDVLARPSEGEASGEWPKMSVTFNAYPDISDDRSMGTVASIEGMEAVEDADSESAAEGFEGGDAERTQDELTDSEVVGRGEGIREIDIFLDEVEVMNLGTFTDPSRLFDVLAIASVQAPLWEEELIPLGDDEYWD